MLKTTSTIKSKPAALATSERRWFVCALLFAVSTFAFAPSIASAQLQGDDVPEVGKGIGVDQKLGDELPLYIEFENEKNNVVRFGELFKDGKPVLLSFNYSDCPQLCNVQLGNFVKALRAIDLVPGKDFQFVSISIDPTEQSKQLAETKEKYLFDYGNMESADGWHFLRGTQKNIRAMADACGFQYKYLPKARQYSHPAAFIFCTADGKISRYIDGLAGNLNTSMKPALVEASKGKIGSLADKVKYFAGCYYFDPTTGKYSTKAIGLMRLAGYATIFGLAIGIAPYWLSRRRDNDREVKEIKDLDPPSDSGPEESLS